MSDVPNIEYTLEELTVLVFQHSRSRMEKRKLARQLLVSAREDDRLKTVYLEIANRIRREKEAKEGKVKLKNILLGVVVMFVLSFLLMGSVVTAQDATAVATVEATVNGEPVDAVLINADATDEAAEGESDAPPSPSDETTVSIWSMILDKLVDFAMIAAIVVLAFKTGSLIPISVVEQALEQGTSVAKSIVSKTPSTLDDSLVNIGSDVLRRLIQEELARRDAAVTIPEELIRQVVDEKQGDFLRGLDEGLKRGVSGGA